MNMRGTRLEAPEDYVQRAIGDTLAGRRTRREGVSMFQHLAGVVSSLISTDAESAPNRGTIAWPQVTGGDGTSRPLDPPTDAPTPEDRVVLRQEQVWQRHLSVRVLAVLEKDPPLKAFAEFVMASDTVPTPRAIADHLGCPVEQIYAMRKKLQRRLAPLLPSLAKEGGR